MTCDLLFVSALSLINISVRAPVEQQKSIPDQASLQFSTMAPWIPYYHRHAINLIFYK